MSLRFSGRGEEQISSAVPMVCYPAQLERERDIEEQPSYLKLKLVLQLILGLSWAAGIIPVCSGGAWVAFPTAVSLCECLKALMLRSWLMCRAFCGEVCVGGVCVCVSLPPGQNTFLCQTSPFQANVATSAWGQHTESPCRTAFNRAIMQGALKCAAAVGLITQVIWVWDAYSRTTGC